MKKKDEKILKGIIRKVSTGNTMLLCVPGDIRILTLEDGKKFSFVDMLTILATQGMAHSGETLTYHPVHGTCYRVENSKGVPLAVIHQGLWDCEDGATA